MYWCSADRVHCADARQNLLQKVHNDLALDATRPSTLHARLATFAAGFLTLCLAAFSGVLKPINLQMGLKG
jgi:hypothetical protein